MQKRTNGVRYVQKAIQDRIFQARHKKHAKDFTRKRHLTFANISLLILRKSTKSLQIVLNECVLKDEMPKLITASAYTQARQKYKHTAFVELNDGIVDIFYSDDDIKRWKGFRCFGCDGSQIILPPTQSVKEKFGTTAIKNQYIEGEYACATFECCYDVLNNIAYKCVLAQGYSYEPPLIEQALPAMQEKDLMIFDRGYASYLFLANLMHHKVNYIIRCPKNSFKNTEPLFKKEGFWSQIVTLQVPQDRKKEAIEKGLPLEIQVRFVSVILDTGEVEVLVTNLMDESMAREDFKTLYGLRWGVEGFFKRLKNRLNLENFTGKSVESVLQDFWSTIFITNLETLVTAPIEATMNMALKPNQLTKKINKSVSFNAIKNMVFELFLREKDLDKIMQKLSDLFKMTPIVQRIDRYSPRKKPSERRSYNFVRRISKQVF